MMNIKLKSDSVFLVKGLQVSKMMNTKLMLDSVSLVKCTQVCKIMNIKLMSDSVSLVKLIKVSKMMNIKFMSDCFHSEMHTGELDDELRAHVTICVPSEIHLSSEMKSGE